MFLSIPQSRTAYPNIYDLIVAILILAVLVTIAWGASGMNKTLLELQATPIVLSPYALPKYALFTTLRMFTAITAAVLVSLILATLAAKNRLAGLIIIPAVDVIQAVPILGFLAFTITFFTRVFPGHEYGAELAAIFAIFTNQMCNLTFSVYQSFITLPTDLSNISKQFGENARQRYWRLELPFAMPGLIWNAMMSMSGGWFFIIASEALAVGKTKISLPGIGSWLALAIEQKNLTAIIWAIIAMVIVIIIYDQLLFRPLVAWSNKFSMTKAGAIKAADSWLYDVIKRGNFLRYLHAPLAELRYVLLCSSPKIKFTRINPLAIALIRKIAKYVWYIFLVILVARAALFIYAYFTHNTAIFNMYNIVHVFVLGMYTLLRVVAMFALASIIWVPLGVFIGLHPNVAKWAQPLALLLAAFPANILFPLAVVVILHFKLNSNIWLAFLFLLGSQWYILFNIIAGIKAYPNELQKTAAIYQIRSWLWWRKVILPGLFPFFVTGGIAAAGGAWNVSIVAEVVNWGNTELKAQGLGAYIAEATAAGNLDQVLLGVVMMSLIVITINITVWRRLYSYAAEHFRY